VEIEARRRLRSLAGRMQAILPRKRSAVNNKGEYRGLLWGCYEPGDSCRPSCYAGAPQMRIPVEVSLRIRHRRGRRCAAGYVPSYSIRQCGNAFLRNSTLTWVTFVRFRNAKGPGTYSGQ